VRWFRSGPNWLILINDGSTDNSRNVVLGLVDQDQHLKYLEFSRNFGKEIATSAGLFHARGQAAIILDADLQHPPELIPEFLDKWEAGADVVIGVRNKNSGEGLVKKLGSVLFYQIMSTIGNTQIMPRATDFRLLDRKVINEFNRFTERTRLTRGLIDWLGFQTDYVYFEARERLNGEAAYSFMRLLKLAFSAFVSHSLFPLKLAGYLGIIITLISGFLGLFMFTEKYILNDRLGLNFSGPALLAVFTLFLVGIILCCLGLIALYIASIHSEVVNRPLYVIKSKKNLE
jgi:polyisoprenyl-phosphate glycosyltransferase